MGSDPRTFQQGWDRLTYPAPLLPPSGLPGPTAQRTQSDRGETGSLMDQWFVLSTIQPQFHSKLDVRVDLAVAVFLIITGTTSQLSVRDRPLRWARRSDNKP